MGCTVHSRFQWTTEQASTILRKQIVREHGKIYSKTNIINLGKNRKGYYRKKEKHDQAPRVGRGGGERSGRTLKNLGTVVRSPALTNGRKGDGERETETGWRGIHWNKSLLLGTSRCISSICKLCS